jgi:hypothetical protein
MIKKSSGPKPRRDHQLYLDETGLLHRAEDKFFGIGLVGSPNINKLHKRLIKYRQRHKFYYEFKFTGINSSNVLYYKGVIDEFFEEPETVFMCSIYDKKELRVRNHEKAYNSFCGKLIAKYVKGCSDSFTNYATVLADDVSTSKDDNFEKEVRAKVKSQVRRNALGTIVRMESHAVTEIQLCDILLGAVAYSYKIDNKLIKINRNKLEVVKHLQKKLRVPVISAELDMKTKKGGRFVILEIKK